ncbi:MAG: permease, partial [Pseudomonadota bacterium]
MASEVIGRYGAPARGLRFFGWLNLFGLLALLINNVLTIAYGFPGAMAAFGQGGGGGALLQLALYVAAFVAAAAIAFGQPDNGLRWEARRISSFNTYLIRACFFAVLFGGIADAAIAFMRIEGLLEVVFPDSIARGMARASWVG